MGLELLAPLTGRVVALAEVPDEVFATEIMGPGLALAPEPDTVVTVVAPCDGELASVHPHAVAIQAGPDGGCLVLVHLGIDTVSLRGRGFTPLVGAPGTVRAGQPVLRWEVPVAVGAGLSQLSPVVVYRRPPVQVVPHVQLGRQVTAGEPLYRVG